MPESLGARLRQQRERQHVTLSSIAEQTKIKQSLLEALERDNVSQWPTGIFRRAFIRAYAIAISLDPDVVVREFLERHPDPTEVLDAPQAGVLGDEASAAGPPTRFRYLVGTAIDSLSRRRTGPPQRDRTAADPPPASAPVTALAPSAPAAPDWLAAARLCTELGRAEEAGDALHLLRQATGILDAVGFIVWAWDPQAAELRPALAHGYSPKVLAQLPRVKRDANNATAAAFRSAETCVVDGNNLDSDALVVPLLTSTGCVGVFAIELQHGGAQREPVRALVTIIAAQLARLVGARRPGEAVDRRLA